MLELFFELALCLTNELLNYIKSLTFGSHGFSIIFPGCTIPNAKIKLITPSSDKIKAAKITVYIVKVFARL